MGKVGDEFLSGALYAAQQLVLFADEPTLAHQYIINGAGYELKDWLTAQRHTGYENRKMNVFLRSCFRDDPTEGK